MKEKSINIAKETLFGHCHRKIKQLYYKHSDVNVLRINRFLGVKQKKHWLSFYWLWHEMKKSFDFCVCQRRNQRPCGTAENLHE